MWEIVIATVYFFLPAGFANMAPIIFQNSLPGLAMPLDGGKKIRGKRIFGDHKTVRGMVCGFAFGILIAYVQSFHPFPGIEIIDYHQWLLLGFVQSVGALGGDLLKSFFKRQMNVAPGQSWVPFDQLDYVLGAILATTFFFHVPWEMIGAALVLGPLFHMGLNRIGYWLKIRESPW